MEANIKTILLAVQQRLAERVPELAYIDKNWGQLDYCLLYTSPSPRDS